MAISSHTLSPLIRRTLRRFVSRERIYIVPTWHGLVFLVGLVWIFFEGALQSNQLVYLLGFILVTLFLLGMFQTNENLKGVEIAGIETAPGPAGGHVVLSLSLMNRSREPRFSLGVQFQMGDRKYRATLPNLRRESREKIEFSFPAGKRGVYGLPRLRLFTPFPLGLFYAWKWKLPREDFFVYPVPEGNTPLRSAVPEEGRALHMEGDDFSGHRLYQRGDPKRDIDWKARARGLPLLVKKFDEGDSGTLALRLDDLRGLELEAKLSQMSLWVHDCYKAAETYALVLPEKTIGPGAGLEHFRSCLRELAEYGGSGA